MATDANTAVQEQPVQESTESNVGASEELGTSATTQTQETQAGTESNVDPSSQASSISLPKEQSKEYAKELMQEYAARFGWNPQDLEANKQAAYAVKKAIDSDIFAAQLKSQLDALTAETETEEETPEQKPAQELTPEQKKQQQTEWFQRVEQFVQRPEVTDPEMAKSFVNELNQAAEDPIKFTQVWSKYAVNLMRTVLPELLFGPGADGKSDFGRMLEQEFSQRYEGFDDHWKDTSKERTWNGIIASDPKYKAIPKLGSPEYAALAQKANALIPGFENVQLKSAYQTDKWKSQILANLAIGNAPDPKLVKEAAESGKREARRAEVNAKSGNLGAGQSQRQNAPAQDRLRAKIEEHRRSENAFADAK